MYSVSVGCDDSTLFGYWGDAFDAFDGMGLLWSIAVLFQPAPGILREPNSPNMTPWAAWAGPSQRGRPHGSRRDVEAVRSARARASKSPLSRKPLPKPKRANASASSEKSW